MARILVVDDEKSIRSFLRSCLEMQSYEVTVCADGFTAFNLCRESAEGFDLIITDLRMPGMDGLQLIEKILAIEPQQAFLAMSGDPSDKEVNWLSDRKIRLLCKPFGPAKLLAILPRVLLLPPE